jgi:hypothetical protein
MSCRRPEQRPVEDTRTCQPSDRSSRSRSTAHHLSTDMRRPSARPAARSSAAPLPWQGGKPCALRPPKSNVQVPPIPLAGSITATALSFNMQRLLLVAGTSWPIYGSCLLRKFRACSKSRVQQSRRGDLCSERCAWIASDASAYRGQASSPASPPPVITSPTVSSFLCRGIALGKRAT